MFQLEVLKQKSKNFLKTVTFNIAFNNEDWYISYIIRFYLFHEGY